MQYAEVECPECGDYMSLLDDGSSQSTQCAECKRFWWWSYDAEFIEDNWGGKWRGTWSAKAMEPPNWRDVEGDLRYHERN